VKSGRHERRALPFLPDLDGHQLTDEGAVQRVEKEYAARFGHSVDFADHFGQVADVLQHVATVHNRISVFGKRNGFPGSLLVLNVQAHGVCMLSGLVERLFRGINASHSKSPCTAQQIIAEVGAQAATFASAKNLVSWVGACPGEEESAGVNRSKRSPKGNRQMRRILNQAANAAVKHKGSIFEIVYRRLLLRLGHNKTIGAIAHRLCQLIWIILHNGARYEERGPTVGEKAKRARRHALRE